MTQKIFRFCTAAIFYWLAAAAAGYVLEIPDKVVGAAVFVPPVLGLMWGLPAALGVYAGAVIPFLGDGFLCLIREFWVFLAGFLPYFFWHRWRVEPDENKFPLSLHTLQKFLEILLITFVITSAVRALTASEAELDAVADWLKTGQSTNLVYAAACFLNDFFLAVFFDLAWLFFLVSRNYDFHASSRVARDEAAETEIHKAWRIALVFYLLFPIGLIYINKFQLYGMEELGTWLHFVAECLTAIDFYLILMLYLLLRYRRSIMLEVVFLVTQTVFLSATVLGGGSSIAIGNLASAHADETLREMSIICRERLYRTFFCIRQAVNGMSLQALNALESYDQLAYDDDFRKNYLEQMKTDFSSIAVGIDGSVSFYLRFIPEIEGTQGGFSMQREDARWEGALSPFLEREPIDLAPYSPDDAQKVGWFYIPMRNRSAIWIEPYVDAVTHFYVISYVAPLFVEGKFIGVVGMDIDFNFIIQELRRMSIYDYGYVYIMDRNNRVLYHKDFPQGSQFQPNPEFQEIEVYLTNGMWLGIALPLSKVNDARNKILMHLIAAIILVAMLISLVSISFASRAIKPLAGMTEAAKRIASGDLNVKISYESGNELGILVRSIREMAAKLEIYVYRDKLTGLRNAAAYISRAADLDAQSKIVPDLKYGVVLFDANFLKKVNDKYGHEAGNELLRHAAAVIRRVFANSHVYRVGGDEFTAILEGQDYDNRQALLEKFDEETAKEQFIVAGDTLTVSVARGLGVYEHGMDFAAVSKTADAAMYNHKLAIKSKYGEDVR